MKLDEAIDWIKNPANKGKAFGIRFVKADGSLRIMKCEMGVVDGIVNNPYNRGVDFKKHDLINVYDLEKKEYRAFKRPSLKAIQLEWDKSPWVSVEAS